MDNQSKKQIRTVPLLRNSSDLLVMVEATGVEPVSENPLTQPSSWVVYLLDFPITSADRQALDQSSPFVHDRVKGESPMHVHH